MSGTSCTSPFSTDVTFERFVHRRISLSRKEGARGLFLDSRSRKLFGPTKPFLFNRYFAIDREVHTPVYEENLFSY